MGVTVTGTITTQNLNPTTGTATPGSFIKLADNSSSTYREPVDSVSVQVTGSYTGVLTPQVSNDGLTWVAVGPLMVYNVGAGTYSQTIASAAVGVFNINVGGVKYFRISANAVVGGTASVTINGTAGAGSSGLTGSVTLSDKIAGEDFNRDAMKTISPTTPTPFSADVLAKAGAGSIAGILISVATTTPSIKIWDSLTATGSVLLETFPVVAGQVIPFYNGEFNTGCFIDITGVVSGTIFWN